MRDNPHGLIGSQAVQRLRRPEKLGSPPLLSAAKLDQVNSMRLSDQVSQGAYAALVREYDLSRVAEGPVSPFLIPNVYNDPEGSAAAVHKIRYDGVAALNFAIRYYLTGSESAATAARNQIEPWLGLTTFLAPAGSDTRLAWSDTWPLFIAAGMLLQKSRAWTPADHDALKSVTRRSIDQGITTTGYPSNQGAWGTVFDFAAAALLQDVARFDRAERDWKLTFNKYVEKNVPVHEVYRQGGTQGNGSSGLGYSNFLVCALTFAAEWARSNGLWLYDHVAPDGSTLRGLHEKVSAWTRQPETFSFNTSGTPSVISSIWGHYEVLQALWPNPDAAWLLANKPIVDRYGLCYLTLTHHGLQLRG